MVTKIQNKFVNPLNVEWETTKVVTKFQERLGNSGYPFRDPINKHDNVTLHLNFANLVIYVFPAATATVEPNPI